ncbi:hypothetical protein [Paenibacillus spongiae]|uniref:Uncharacterized protein n=1 Tax=Paenibacillus spongiae TaxID=2909671 RepID=A0ABY5SEW8_9BACL|nr:hypothetical protein [Paenibacillus spongiae]UVI31218.1 hypothetical protein L1F29_05070 [Paenibacillus spongiae]
MSGFPGRNGNDSAVKSVQRGITVASSTAGTVVVPISPVKMNKSVVILTSCFTYEAGQAGWHDISVYLSSEKEITIKHLTGGSTNSMPAEVAWQVVEYF